MSKKSTRTAAILLIVFPTVVFGGVSILSLLISDPAYAENALRQDFWRAGHAHAGVLLILSLVALRYVDQAQVGETAKQVVRLSFPVAAILMPAGFFLSVLSPDATEPNDFIYLTFAAVDLLIAGMIILGWGLWKAARE